MSDRYAVLSAFLDDEPFDPGELIESLAEPAGRDLLIDLIALRHLARTERKEAIALMERDTWRPALRALLGVAAVLVALVGGYVAGQRHGEAASSAPPPATRVVPVEGPWHVIPPGGLQ